MTVQYNHASGGRLDESILPRYLTNLAGYRHTPWIIALIYVIVTGTIGLYFNRIGDYEVETDFYPTYVPNAQEIRSGNLIIDEFKGPGYPLLLAAGKVVLGDFFGEGVIISRKPRAPYYLGMAFHPLPLVNSVGELLEYCHVHRIDYVFAGIVGVVLRPELSTLPDATRPPEGFSPIVRTDAFDAVLYNVEPKGTK